jgi:uncharacterized protein involved in cysteine biosynthesis
VAGASPPRRRAAPLSPLRDAARGFRTLFDGLGLLRRQRRLWALASVPLLFSIAFVTLAVGLVIGFAGEVHAFLTFWMPALEAGAWYTWLWIGPARLLLALVGYALFLVATAVAVLAGLLVANLVASPFLDVLSWRVEQIVTGAVEEQTDEGVAGLLRDAVRSLANESRRLLFFLVVAGVIVAVGVVVPGAQLLAGPALTAFTILFLPLDYTGFVLDRRRVAFRERRSWVWRNLSTMAGFGSAAFATSLIPGLNLLMLPALVVAGTLLALRNPLEPAAEAPSVTD